jgi:hypothetical protein
MIKNIPTLATVGLLALALTACSPRLDWREVHGGINGSAPYSALLPAKPASFARDMEINGIKMTMQMTAAEVDGTSFAIGTTKLADHAQALAAMEAIKAGMVANVRGKVQESAGAAANDKAGALGQEQLSQQLEASGTLPNGKKVKMVARFVARGPWVYQAVMLGDEQLLTQEAVDMFLGSFKPG